MSKTLQRFVDGFFKGWGLGLQGMHYSEQRADREEQRKIARAKLAQDASRHAERMGLDREKGAAYIELARANAAKARAKAAGGGAAAGPSAGAQQFIEATGGLGLEVPSPERQPTYVTVQPDDTATVDAPPSSSSGEPELARGGKVGQAFVGGINTGMRSAAYQDARERQAAPAPIARTSSTQTYDGGGTSGPGSGYGDQSAPPVQPQPTAIRPVYPGGDNMHRGGKVQKFQDGGEVSYPVEYTSPEERMRSMAWRNQQSRMSPGETGGQPEPGTPGRYPSSPVELMSDRDFETYVQRAANMTRNDMAAPAQVGPAGGADVDPTRVRRGGGAPPAGPRPSAEPRAVDAAGAAGLNVGDPYPPQQAAPAPTGGGGGGAPRQAISTAWKRLSDPTRTAAYDPEKDRMDPDNLHPLRMGREAQGETNLWAMDREGRQPIPRPTDTAPGGPMAYKAGAAEYATAVSGGTDEGQAKLYSGAGSPDPKVVEGVFKVVDPDNKLSVGDRVAVAARTTYDFYKQQGNEAEAKKAAFEITQYGVSKSREHGVAAIKAAQSGDMQGAVQQLTQGYDWLPNGQQAVVQGNQIVVMDRNRKPLMQLPLDAKTIQNLAMGMATGKLGWDAMGAAPPTQGAPPGAPPPQGAPAPGPARPAAQPSAAPAGPAAPPAAPPPAPAQAVQTTVPTTAPAGPPRPSAAAAPAPAQAKPPEQKQPEQGGGEGGQQKSVEDQQKAQETALREWYAKNPTKPPPGDIARVTAQDPKNVREIDQAIADNEQIYEQNRTKVMKLGNQLLTGKGEKQYLTKTLQALKAQHDAGQKELKDRRKGYIDEQNKQDRYDREVVLKPREVTLDQEKVVEKQQADRMDAQRQDPKLAGPNKNTVLRFAVTPEQKGDVLQVAKELWRQNRHLTADLALDRAIVLTSIKPDGEGLNMQKGKDALQFLPEAGDARRGYRVRTASGEQIHVDANTYRQIVQLHAQNWDHYQRKKGEAETDKADVVTRGANLGVRGLRAVAPFFPPLAGAAVGEYVGRKIRE